MSFHQTVKKSFGKQVVLYAAAACFTICSASTVEAQKANFSGEWKLNEAKSTLGQYSQMAPRKMKVDGQKDSLSIQRSSVSPDGNESTYNEKVTFDGKETESTLFGNSKKKSTAKWSDDGQTLTVNSTILFDRDGQSFEVKVVETWKFTEAGKVLSVQSASTSQMGDNAMSLFYDKAN